MSLGEVRARFGPPATLAGPTPGQATHALDSALNACGGYSLIQHALAMGQGAFGSQFMGYPALSSLSQNGLISACINTLADDMTRSWVGYKREGLNDNTVVDEDGNGEDDRLEFIKKEDARLKLQNVFHEAAQKAAQFGGCLIFIDTGANDDELALPLTSHSIDLKNNGIKRLVLVEPINCSPGTVNTLDPLKPDYYEPADWWILTRRVHASRLIKVTGVEPPLLLKPAYNFLGIPHAQILYDYVLHFNECRVAAQRLLKKFSLTIFKTKMGEILYQNRGTEQLQRRVKLFVNKRSNDGVQCIDAETEDMIKLETPLGGVVDIVRQALEFIVAINRTPEVKLLGISPSGFNTGDSDLKNYYDHVKSQQEKILRQGHERIIELTQIHKFGEVDDLLTFEYDPLNEEDKKLVADTRKVEADTDAVYINSGVLSPEEVRRKLSQDPESGYELLETEDVDGEDDAAFMAEVDKVMNG